MKHVTLHIYGAVQGVFFRAFAKRKAEEFGLVGLAQNMPDGSIRIDIEGQAEALKKFTEACHKGPAEANIERIEVTEGEIQNYSDFQVIR